MHGVRTKTSYAGDNLVTLARPQSGDSWTNTHQPTVHITAPINKKSMTTAEATLNSVWDKLLLNLQKYTKFMHVSPKTA